MMDFVLVSVTVFPGYVIPEWADNDDDSSVYDRYSLNIL